MEKKQHPQIIITTVSKNDRQKFPVNLLITLAAGAIAGVAMVFGLFLGIEVLFSL